MRTIFSIRARCLTKWQMTALTGLLICALNSNCEMQQSGSTVYDPNPKHLWNRLNETLFDRIAPDSKQYGLDELDILYWGRTTHLLTEPSHQRTLAVLDEF